MHCLTNTLYTPEAPPTVIIPSPRGEPVDPDAPPPGPIVIPEQVREFQQEFESALPLLEGTSLTRRPDAVSVDYQFAFCLGPIDYGDGTQGANVKVWRAYVEGNAIYVAREDDAGTGWRDGILTFSLDDAFPFDEIDVAFDQNGQPVLAVEMNGHIWLYWFNTAKEDPETGAQSGGWDWTDWGSGRTPRLILDYPEDPAFSDVLFSYVSVDADKVVVRQQRDRYDIIYGAPSGGAGDKYLEDVYRVRDYRIWWLMSVHDEAAGTWSFSKFASSLYPVIEYERLRVEALPIIGYFVDAQLLELTLHAELLGAELGESFLFGYDLDALRINVTISSGSLPNETLFIINEPVLPIAFMGSVAHGVIYDPLIHENDYMELAIPVAYPIEIDIGQDVITHTQLPEDALSIQNRCRSINYGTSVAHTQFVTDLAVSLLAHIHGGSFT